MLSLSVYSLTCVADNIRPVSLPKRSDVIKTFAKEKAFLTGWGSTPDGPLENRKMFKFDLKNCTAGLKPNTMLTRNSMTIIEPGDCWKMFGDIVTHQTLCTAGKDIAAPINTCFVSSHGLRITIFFRCKDKINFG